MRLLLFLLTPLIELYLLIRVGEYIGAGPMVAWVVVSAAFGVGMLRRQGIAVLQRGMGGVSAGSGDAALLIEGFLAAVAAALLIVPGLVTDVVGLILLVPFVRGRMAARIGRRAQIYAGSPAPGAHPPGRVIEGEFQRRP